MIPAPLDLKLLEDFIEYYSGRPDAFRNPMCDDAEKLLRESLTVLRALTAERDEFRVALSNHLCPHDMADWMACRGHHSSEACSICAGEDNGQHRHALLIRAEAAEATVAAQAQEIARMDTILKESDLMDLIDRLKAAESRADAAEQEVARQASRPGENANDLRAALAEIARLKTELRNVDDALDGEFSSEEPCAARAVQQQRTALDHYRSRADAAEARLREMEIDTIDHVAAHWFIQGGEAQFGALDLPVDRTLWNADVIVAAILSRVRKPADATRRGDLRAQQHDFDYSQPTHDVYPAEYWCRRCRRYAPHGSICSATREDTPQATPEQG